LLLRSPRRRALLGRTFDTSETDPPLPDAVVLLGHDLFERRFGADRAIPGGRFELNGEPFTVAGILPPGFHGLTGRAELWIPMTAFDVVNPELVTYRILESRGTRWHSVAARLAPGATRYLSTLMGAFAVLSVLLSAVGLYGVVSFSVSRSTHELGVRLALGSVLYEVDPLDVLEGM
jgi:hypothetical protein